MSRGSPVELLVELARRELEGAERSLGAQLAAQRNLHVRGVLLGQYRNDYVGRLQQSAHSGTQADALCRLHAFVERLGDAQVSQVAEEAAMQARVEAARAAVLEARRKLEGFETLLRRREALSRLQARRAEQSAQDEAAARRASAGGRHHLITGDAE